MNDQSSPEVSALIDAIAATAQAFKLDSSTLKHCIRDLPTYGKTCVLGIVNSIPQMPVYFGNDTDYRRMMMVSVIDQSCRHDQDFLVTIFLNNTSEALSRSVNIGDVLYLPEVVVKLFKGKVRGVVRNVIDSGLETVIIDSSSPCSANNNNANNSNSANINNSALYSHHPSVRKVHRELEALQSWWQAYKANFSILFPACNVREAFPGAPFPYTLYSSSIPEVSLSQINTDAVFNIKCRVVGAYLEENSAVFIIEDGTVFSKQTLKNNYQDILNFSTISQDFSIQTSCKQVPVLTFPPLLSYAEQLVAGDFYQLRHVQLQEIDGIFRLVLKANQSTIIKINPNHSVKIPFKSRLTPEPILEEHFQVNPTPPISTSPELPQIPTSEEQGPSTSEDQGSRVTPTTVSEAAQTNTNNDSNVTSALVTPTNISESQTNPEDPAPTNVVSVAPVNVSDTNDNIPSMASSSLVKHVHFSEAKTNGPAKVTPTLVPPLNASETEHISNGPQCPVSVQVQNITSDIKVRIVKDFLDNVKERIGSCCMEKCQSYLTSNYCSEIPAQNNNNNSSTHLTSYYCSEIPAPNNNNNSSTHQHCSEIPAQNNSSTHQPSSWRGEGGVQNSKRPHEETSSSDSAAKRMAVGTEATSKFYFL